MNFSDSIFIINNINFGTSTGMLRYMHRMQNDMEFFDGLGNFGILLNTIKMVNHKIYLHPDIVDLGDGEFVVNFVKKKFFDLSLMFDLLNKIMRISDEVMEFWEDMFGSQFDPMCIDALQNNTKFIH